MKKWYANNPSDGMIADENTGNTIARCVWAKDNEEYEEHARLIAAAPTLLTMAKGALAALSQNKTFPADIKAAKELLKTAIARAEGGEGG